MLRAVRATVCLVLVAGCAAPPSASEQTSETLAKTHPTAVLDAALFEIRSLAVPREIELQNACLAKLGFSYRLSSPEPTMPPAEARLWGLIDAAQAKNVAYGGALPGSEDSESVPIPADALAALIPDTPGPTVEVTNPDGVLLGSVEQYSGCAGEATAAVYGRFETYASYSAASMLLSDLKNKAYTAAQASNEFVTLQAAWSACMSTAGFDFSSVLEPFRRDWSAEESRDLELATAEADVQCKQTVGFVDAANTLVWSKQRDELERFPDLLNDITHVRDQVKSGG